jgi:hypothetical protein
LCAKQPSPPQMLSGWNMLTLNSGPAEVTRGRVGKLP